MKPGLFVVAFEITLISAWVFLLFQLAQYVAPSVDAGNTHVFVLSYFEFRVSCIMFSVNTQFRCTTWIGKLLFSSFIFVAFTIFSLGFAYTTSHISKRCVCLVAFQWALSTSFGSNLKNKIFFFRDFFPSLFI